MIKGDIKMKLEKKEIDCNMDCPFFNPKSNYCEHLDKAGYCITMAGELNCAKCGKPLSKFDIKQGYLYCSSCELDLNAQHREHMKEFNTYEMY